MACSLTYILEAAAYMIGEKGKLYTFDCVFTSDSISATSFRHHPWDSSPGIGELHIDTFYEFLKVSVVPCISVFKGQYTISILHKAPTCTFALGMSLPLGTNFGVQAHLLRRQRSPNAEYYWCCNNCPTYSAPSGKPIFGTRINAVKY